MIFLADESVDHQIVIQLRRDGHEVIAVAEMEPGITDDAVFHWANKRGAVLITADKDFGEIVFRQRQMANGVILIRLIGLDQETKAELVSKVLLEHLGRLVGSFTVVTPRHLRIRKKW